MFGAKPAPAPCAPRATDASGTRDLANIDSWTVSRRACRVTGLVDGPVLPTALLILNPDPKVAPMKLPYGAVTTALKRGMVPTGPSLDAIGTWLEGVENPWPEVEAGVARGLLTPGEYAFLACTHGGPLPQA